MTKSLQQVTKIFALYFKNSKEVNDKIVTAQLPIIVTLLIVDAVSMNKNMDTGAAPNKISEYPRQTDSNFPSIPTNKLFLFYRLLCGMMSLRLEIFIGNN